MPSAPRAAAALVRTGRRRLGAARVGGGDGSSAVAAPPPGLRLVSGRVRREGGGAATEPAGVDPSPLAEVWTGWSVPASRHPRVVALLEEARVRRRIGSEEENTVQPLWAPPVADDEGEWEDEMPVQGRNATCPSDPDPAAPAPLLGGCEHVSPVDTRAGDTLGDRQSTSNPTRSKEDDSTRPLTEHVSTAGTDSTTFGNSFTSASREFEGVDSTFGSGWGDFHPLSGTTDGHTSADQATHGGDDEPGPSPRGEDGRRDVAAVIAARPAVAGFATPPIRKAGEHRGSSGTAAVDPRLEREEIASVPYLAARDEDVPWWKPQRKARVG